MGRKDEIYAIRQRIKVMLSKKMDSIDKAMFVFICKRYEELKREVH